MRKKNEQNHALARAGFVGTLTGGFIGTNVGLLFTAFLIRNMEQFDSKKFPSFLLLCLLSTPTCGIAGAAAGGTLSVAATEMGRRTLSFFQELFSDQDPEAAEVTSDHNLSYQ